MDHGFQRYCSQLDSFQTGTTGTSAKNGGFSIAITLQ